MSEVKYRVLPEYRDENLADTVKGGVLEILRTVPDEWRQSVMSAAWRDCNTPKCRPSSHDPMLLESYTVPTGVDHYDALRARAAQAIAGTLSPRRESVEDPA